MSPADIVMTHETFVSAFEDGTLPPEVFSHRAHVRLAWIYLRRYPLADAADRFTRGIRAFAARVGKPEKYHETITWAYLLLIQDRLAREAGSQEARRATPSSTTTAGDFDTFAEANADLLTNGRAALERWYRPETLDSPLARATFIWPDRLPADIQATTPLASASTAPSSLAGR